MWHNTKQYYLIFARACDIILLLVMKIYIRTRKYASEWRTNGLHSRKVGKEPSQVQLRG